MSSSWSQLSVTLTEDALISTILLPLYPPVQGAVVLALKARAHLGFQSQRQWAKAATTRTTPVILAIFSLVCLIAHRLHSVAPLSPRTTAWYSKSELTFADLLNAVRLCLWRERIFPRPAFHSVLALFSDDDREQLIQLLAAPF